VSCKDEKEGDGKVICTLSDSMNEGGPSENLWCDAMIVMLLKSCD
jgi:hypothetical protein